MRIPKPTDADRDRFRALVPDEPDVETKPMFGNLGAFVNGNMFMGLFGSDVGVRLDEPDRSELAAVPGAGAVRPERAVDGRLRHDPRRLDRLRGEALDRQGARGRVGAAAQAAEEEGGEDVSVDVQTDIVVDRPVDVAAAYAADPSNAPEWYANIDSVDWQTPPPATVGSKMTFVARFLGRRLEYTFEIVEFVPGERLVMRTAQGPFPMQTTYTWAPNGDGATRMTLRNRGEPAGFSKLMAPFMAPAMRRANRKDLANLKAILEAT